VPLYQLFGGKAPEHIELHATLGLPQGVVPPAEAATMGLKERAAATMAAGYRVYGVDSSRSLLTAHNERLNATKHWAM
jgi:hypothetical protein